jgi:hypothetical protein
MSYERLPCLILPVLLASGCGASEPPPPTLEETLQAYLAAANRHDLDAVGAVIADDATWVLFNDTLVGKAEVMSPLRFDEGANTVLELSNVVVRGDTVDFDLLERNDVLEALGIAELHHSPRFIFRDGLIHRKMARRPPAEAAAFGDSLGAFVKWLTENDPEAVEFLWPDGQFNYSREAGQAMPELVMTWRQRNR